METVSIYFSVPDYMKADSAAHQLSNIADSIWPQMIAVERCELENGRYRMIMEVMHGRRMRKKEREDLIQKVGSLAKSDPALAPEIRFPS